MSVLHTARLVGRRLGLEIQRAGPLTLPATRIAKMLNQRGVATILDIGANDGGYASEMLGAGFKGKIISFEPLPDAHRALIVKAGRSGGRWMVGPQIAISDTDGETTFHEARNSVSSSLLVMTDIHISAAPRSARLREFTVRTMRLDTVLSALDVYASLFLKIDVQGAEKMVLEGAREALGTGIVGVQLEMSLDALYEGQPTARELDEILRAKGFELWDIIPGFRDPTTHRLLQYDGIYFRV